MKNSAFNFDSVDLLLEKLKRNLNEVHEESMDEYKEFIPSSEYLKLMIEFAFFASLKKEEGRDTIFTLVFAPPPNLSDEYSIEAPVSFVFETPQLFTINNIVKLAPALNLADFKIGVWFNQEDNKLSIWGWRNLLITETLSQLRLLKQGNLLSNF